MHQIYFLMRIYPYWALPMAFVLGQVGVHFRRRKQKIQYSFWGMVAILVLSSLAWIGFRGDINAHKWVRWAERGDT